MLLFLLYRIDFYYIAPELQSDDVDADDNGDYDTVEGSTDVDLQALSTVIELPSSITSLNFVLTNDLFIQTPSIDRAIKTLKQLVVPQKKNVRFALETLNSNTSSSSPQPPSPSSKAKSQRKHVQFEPYSENVRRSNRIAKQRRSSNAF